MIKPDYEETIVDTFLRFDKFMKAQDFSRFNNLMHILPQLPLAKIRKGYELDGFSCGDRWGSVIQPYCCKEGATEVFNPIQDKEESRGEVFEKICHYYVNKKSELKDIENVSEMTYNDSLRIASQISYSDSKSVPYHLPYFEFPWTEEGIIQAWLLDSLTDFMPKGWHCGYSCKEFILTEEQLQGFIKKARSQGPVDDMELDTLLPRVTINDDTAIVECSYWNDWSGIVKFEVEAHRCGNSITFDSSEPQVLAKYKCGIKF